MQKFSLCRKNLLLDRRVGVSQVFFFDNKTESLLDPEILNLESEGDSCNKCPIIAPNISRDACRIPYYMFIILALSILSNIVRLR